MARSQNTQNTVGSEERSAPLSPAELNKISSAQMREVDQRTQKNFQTLRASKKIQVQISPLYKPYFGEKMAVGLNGLFIYVPLDGRQYAVPRQYARIIKSRIRQVDELSAKTNRMSDVQSNLESSPGILPLLTK